MTCYVLCLSVIWVIWYDIGLSGTTFKLLKSFLTCGIPQGSVLGPFEFCNSLIPLRNILKYYNVHYHMHADDTQVYIAFKLKTLHEAIDTIN